MSTSRIHARGPVGIQVLAFAAAMMMINHDDDDGDDLLCLRAQTLNCVTVLSSLCCAGSHVNEVGAHVFCGVRCHMGVCFGIAVLLSGI